ncbi:MULTISPECIES: hypothetical protein [Bacillus]|uniref:hypothetical protein n=1 Tax=Bacillus TaxID=1386 RepID=UPI001E477003|nr:MULTISPECIES: hypothetical protein [Bacillus]
MKEEMKQYFHKLLKAWKDYNHSLPKYLWIEEAVLIMAILVFIRCEPVFVFYIMQFLLAACYTVLHLLRKHSVIRIYHLSYQKHLH